MRLLQTLLFCFSVLTALANLAAAEGRRAILVLDASGSMWGQISGEAKIDIAKDVVAKIIKDWKPEDELGLVAYGHRQKGSCTDIETLIEPVPLTAEGYLKAVRGLSPKGKTPMTQSVRQAAEALKFTEKEATVILVSDGIETCDADPCAVATELEKLGVGLTVHTVGFGLDDKGAVSQLKCLAENTGGISILAENAGELEAALRKTVEAQPAPAPQPAKIDKNFKGKVMMAEGVELPQDFASAAWDFSQSAGGAYVKTEYGGSVETALEQAGNYVLRITNDTVKMEVPVVITDGEVTDMVVPLDAGVVEVTGTTDGTQTVPEGSAFELANAEGAWITTKYGQSVRFLVKAGAAKVGLQVGSAKAEQDVMVEAGKTVKVSLSLGAGSIEASAVYSAGGDGVPAGAALELSEGKAGVDGKHKWIDTQYGAPSMFKAPAGDYVIAASKDYARGETMVSIKPGEAAKAVVVMNAGYLAVSAAGAASFDVSTAEKDISGNRKWIGTEYGDSFNKAFNAGKYHVLAKAQDGTVVGEKEFEVTAGGRTEASLP